MPIRKSFLAFLIVLTFIIIACSASTGSRYANEKDETTKPSDKIDALDNKGSLNEDFDITPYKTKILLPEKPVENFERNEEIWFTYEKGSGEVKKKSIVSTGDGYRVLILTTDNIDEANQIKSEIYFSNKIEEVYVDFEPPFYKVKIGDFESERNANDLRFKLNQQGYHEAKVIKDKINKFE